MEYSIETKFLIRLNMKIILQKSFLKCIDPKNKSGITFLEVVIVGLLIPLVLKTVKRYVLNLDFIFRTRQVS